MPFTSFEEFTKAFEGVFGGPYRPLETLAGEWAYPPYSETPS